MAKIMLDECEYEEFRQIKNSFKEAVNEKYYSEIRLEKYGGLTIGLIIGYIVCLLITYLSSTF